MESNELKSIVKQKYGEIAEKSLAELNASTCCGTECCSPHDLTRFNDDYTQLKGYSKEADLKLGCGVPTEAAAIELGDTVLDLGSGAGNDAFVARALVGENGTVIGLDMTEAMIEKARKNATSLGYKNVEFRLGDIEEMPIDSDSIDVVISNCVLNLVPDKKKAFSEMYRVIKAGGHFAVSDIVLAKELPSEIQQAAQMYAGCVSGAILKSDYLSIIEQAGFKNVQVKLEKAIHLPLEVLLRYLAAHEADAFLKDGAAVLSITVYAEK